MRGRDRAPGAQHIPLGPWALSAQHAQGIGSALRHAPTPWTALPKGGTWAQWIRAFLSLLAPPGNRLSEGTAEVVLGQLQGL